MGKKLDSLLKRSTLKSSKFIPLFNLALHRLAVLKNHRQVRCNIAKSDVVEILKLGLHDRALLRVEHVIKEQNMLDVLQMVESYCNLVLERFHLISQDKTCPDELKEAIASLLYAASRCGEFPELQEIRAVFTSHYGKEFAARAVELRNNCGVSPKLIQKLSTRMPSLESRMSVLKQIADEKGITLQLGESSFEHNQAEVGPREACVASPRVEDDNADMERYFGSVKAKKYENAADAAQAAFESAAYAAHAARAAVELSRGDSHDSEGSNSPYARGRKLTDHPENAKFGTHILDEQVSNVDKDDNSNTPETGEALGSLKRFGSISSETNENLTDSEAMDTHTPKKESETIYIKYHANKMEHNTASASSDPLVVSITDEQAKAADSEDLAMLEDPVNQGDEGSWIRRGWHSNMERMKRPFSHRSRGVVAAR